MSNIQAIVKFDGITKLAKNKDNIRNGLNILIRDLAIDTSRFAHHRAPLFKGFLSKNIRWNREGILKYSSISNASYSAEREIGEGLPDTRPVKGDPHFEKWWLTKIKSPPPSTWTVLKENVRPFMEPSAQKALGVLDFTITAELDKIMEV